MTIRVVIAATTQGELEIISKTEGYPELPIITIGLVEKIPALSPSRTAR